MSTDSSVTNCLAVTPASPIAGSVSFTPGAGLFERVDVLSTGSGAVSLSVADRQVTLSGAVGASTSTSNAAGVDASFTVVLRPLVISSTDRYSHGDVVVTTDGAGKLTGGPFRYDPYGQALSNGLVNNQVVPDNSNGSFDAGWVGSDQRPYEHAGTIALIQMGARPYIPSLGRFTALDPVEGGNLNDYIYPTDPVNQFDLNGRDPRASYHRYCQGKYPHGGGAGDCERTLYGNDHCALVRGGKQV